jgi:hypothetical protein
MAEQRRDVERALAGGAEAGLPAGAQPARAVMGSDPAGADAGHTPRAAALHTRGAPPGGGGLPEVRPHQAGLLPHPGHARPSAPDSDGNYADTGGFSSSSEYNHVDARSLTSGEYLLGLAIAPSSQGMEPPGIPGRFRSSVSGTRAVR